MAEPIPLQSEALKPPSITIGETPIYLTEPVTIDGAPVTSFSVLSTGDRALSGAGSAVILTREPSRAKENRGELVDKENLNFDRMDVKPWGEISGIRFRDESGNMIDVPNEKLTLEPVSVIEPKITLPEKSPVLPTAEARAVLENLAEDPNTITIVGLKAYETRALDLADRSMQKLVTEHKNALEKIHDFVFTGIWKKSIGGIYFHEKSRQYYMDMLKASETPFAEDAIRLSERRATDLYNKKLADANFIKRIGTKAADWLKDKVGMRTTIQTLALEEISSMKTAGEIRGIETFEREAKAIRARFGSDFDTADQFVRKQLGEKLEILDPENSEHKPLVEGIQTLLKQYANGEIADKSEFDNRTKEFFNTTLKNTRPDIFAEAELYSSSLFDVAETLRTKMSHEGGLANVDEAIAGMQVRLGLGQMGEVTSLDPTAVEKGIHKVRDIAEWLNKKNVLVPLVLNEATIGSGLALFLSGINFFKTMPAAAFGAGALAGGAFAGWREYGQLQKDYLTHLREKESGATFTETQKRRAWFEKFAVQQRSASEMITTIQTAMDAKDYRNAMATIADISARKAVSENGPKKIGLIRFSNRETIESERTALDMTASKALRDLGNVSDLGDLGGNTLSDFMVKLTTGQTQVLREGVAMLANQEDPVYATLNLINQYAPEAAMIERRWPFAKGEHIKAAGLDAIMEEFKTESRIEAVKYGIKAGVIGAAVGAAFHGVGELFSGRIHLPDLPTIQDSGSSEGYMFAPDIAGSPTETVSLTYTNPHTFMLGTQPVELPDQLDIVTHYGPPDEIRENTYDVFFRLSDGNRVELGTDLSSDDLKDSLINIGLTIENDHLAVDTPTAPISPTPVPIPVPNTDIESPGVTEMTIKGSDFSNQGLWQYFLNQTEGTEHQMATTNGMKNLLRLYLLDNPDAITATGDLPMREATLGHVGTIQEIDIAHIPADATLTLPEAMFNHEGVTEFAKLTNDGLDYANDLLAKGDAQSIMDAIRLMEQNPDELIQTQAVALRLGYVGVDEALPTGTDLDPLYAHFQITAAPADTGIPSDTAFIGASAGLEIGSTIPTDKFDLHGIADTLKNAGPMRIVDADADGTVTIPYQPYTQAQWQRLVEAAGEQMKTMEGLQSGFSEQTSAWIPIFIPYRSILEAATGEIVSTALPRKDTLLSPFGMEDVFVTKETLDARKSPRLIEKNDAKLNQQEEIHWYLSGLSPEESQTLESLLSQEQPPIAPEIRAVVTIPMSQSGTNVYQRLASYVGQTNADGTPLDLKKIEYIVYDTRVATPEGTVNESLPASTKGDVDRFIADHPDMRIVYLTHTYTESPTAGRVKRDMTNVVMNRIATLPLDTSDVAIVSDNATGNAIAPTYLSDAIDAFDTNPALDLVSGTYAFPQEAYEQFPLVFAQHRAFEIMDSLVRHGETDHVPGIYFGNMSMRASSLAAVGGYNPNAAIAEDREISWMLQKARNSSDTMTILANQTATLDPKETIYAHLQREGKAEPTVPLISNEVYKDMSWQDMGKIAAESYTRNHLEMHLSNMYEHMYPTLKAEHPERYNAYFKRTMDALGLPYEIADESVKLMNIEQLSANIATPMNLEDFARTEAPVIVESTPINPRETLESLAGEPSPEELPKEKISSSISSPETTIENNLTPQPEILPTGIEERINYVLNRTKETETANVALTPGELMDYLKSSIDIAGTRITQGKILIDGNTVKLQDMKANIRYNAAHIGEGNFSATLLSDPQKGLVVDHKTLTMKLPFMIKLVGGEGMLRKQLDDFNGLVLGHLDSRIDQKWKADRIDVVEDKLQIKFAKKP